MAILKMLYTFRQFIRASFPNLAPLALQYQALPATSASVERFFSIAGLGFKGKTEMPSSRSYLRQILFASLTGNSCLEVKTK